MTAEEKAKELYEKYLPFVDCGDNRYTTTVQEQNAKQCALIAVDEIIQLRKGYFSCENPMNDEAYWLHVKNHLNNM